VISNSPNYFRFAGEQLDPSTSLYNLRARYYAPAAGRFMSRDPFPGLATRPQSQHPYTYVSNNSVNRIDPSGLYGYHYRFSLDALGAGGPTRAMALLQTDLSIWWFGIRGDRGETRWKEGRLYNVGPELKHKSQVKVDRVAGTVLKFTALKGHLIAPEGACYYFHHSTRRRRGNVFIH